MAYTRAWTNTTPADTDQASTLGAVTRNLRADIQERMDTLLGSGNWAVDPVAGFPVTKVMYLSPATGFSPDSNPWAVDFGTVGDPHSIHPTSISSSWYVPFRVPTGATLTKVRCALRNTSIGSNIRGFAVWNSTLITSPNVATLGQTTNVTTVAALAWYDFGISNHVVAAGDIFTTHILTAGGSTAHYHGLEVTYTVPDLLTSF
jgi:hypothetical protein